MTRTIFDLTDGHLAKLELHRQAFGLRSAVAAMRHLIENFAKAPMRMPAPDPRTDQVADVAFGRPAHLRPGAVPPIGDAAPPAQTAAGAAVPFVGTIKQKPYQKGEKR